MREFDMLVNCLLIGSFNNLNQYDGYQNEVETLLKRESVCFEYSNMLFELYHTYSFLSKQGYTCRYVESVRDLAELKSQKSYSFEIILLISSFFKSISEYRRIVIYVRKNYPEAKILIGGRFIKNILYKLEDHEILYLLKHIGADYYINRDECLYEVNQYLKTNRADDIANILYIKHNHLKKSDENHTTVAHSTICLQHDFLQYYDKEIITLQTSRNCKFQCAFCAIKDENENYVEYDLCTLDDQLQVIDDNPTIKSVFFNDETINFPQGKFYQFLQLMLHRRFHFNWFSFFRCQYLDNHTAALLNQSNCKMALLGLESGCDQQLERMNKQVTAAQLQKGIDFLYRNNVYTYGLFIVGFPGENEESIEKTIQFINNSHLDFYIINQWTCEMGTKIWEQRDRYQLVCRNGRWKHTTMTYEESLDKIRYIESRVTSNAINAKMMDVNFIIQLHNRHYSKKQIAEIILKFRNDWLMKHEEKR